MATNYIVINGYVFDYTVAYQTSNGTCDPCFATDSYAMLRYNGYTVEEGVPSTWGLGYATNTNMSYCPV